jgi:threonine dehydrogenase-like Zn-dependent dehydrogenase
MKTMRAIVNTGPGALELREWPLPQPGAGQVRIRTAACAVCATDLKMIAGWERTGFPSIPGHEWSGTVDAVGAGIDAGLVGRPCVAENVLADHGEVGFEHPGGYGEYLLTEAANLHPLPASVALAEAALIEPLAVAVRAVRRLRVHDASRALVFGDGAIGLLVLLLLKGAGVGAVYLVGGRPERLALAVELGAAGTLDYHRTHGNMADAVAAAWRGPFPNVVEASGAAAAAAAAIEVAAPGGHVLLLGDYGDARAAFGWNRVLLRELELAGSNASAGAWPEAVRLATSRALPLSRLVTHRLPAPSFAEALAIVRDRDSRAIKVVLEW